MSQDVSGGKSKLALFRQHAVHSAGHRLFGNVAIMVPPSGSVALFIAVLSLAALGSASWIVEVPMRSRAVGVVMPDGGFVDVLAGRAGQVVDVFVSAGQLVPKEQLLITIGPGGQLNSGSASEANLRSLQNERALVNEAYAIRQDLAAGRLGALDEQMSTAARQLEIAEQRDRSLYDELGILEKRFQRREDLVRAGHLARDAFELEQANLIRARADYAEFKHTIVDRSQAMQTISRSRTEARKQLDLDHFQHAIAVERLQRDIERERHDALQELHVSQRSVVAQVLVRPGDAVRPGQVLAKLRRPGDRMQAWLYLSTSTARLLRKGQSVEISLDAYPRQVFGTHTAIVSSVSGIALLPKDIRAPLLLAGPVFEVKADLEQHEVSAEGARWPLSPGTSFSADIIQRRFRLYEWLFRSRPGASGDGHG